MVYGYINKIIPFSSVDGPGNRTAIFLQGCNFNCAYCHNPETINKCGECGGCISVCPTEALKKIDGNMIWDKNKCCECDACTKKCPNNSSAKIMKMSAQDVINEISKYRAFITGITVSGGECTLQEEFLIDLFKKAKEIGLTCFIDSNGSNYFANMKELTDLCDKVMLDVKSWDSDIHNKYIEFDNNNVIKNLEYLISKNKLYEARTVVVPDVFNNEETVEEVSRVIGKMNSEVKYKLIKFRAIGIREKFKNINGPSNEYMDMLSETAKKNGCENILIV